MNDDPVAVIGAGPYGLSVAAYLQQHGIPARIFGKTMQFWSNMPDGMHLKSVWSASSLSDHAQRYTLDAYTASLGAPKREPITLPYFVAYGKWFAERAGFDVDPTFIRTLARDGDGRFHLELDDGRSLAARKVVVATGIDSFASVPKFARHLPPELASHTKTHKDFERFRGKRVAVLGRGQSAVQTAAFLHETGAEDVELLARGPVIWINRKLYNKTGPAKHIFYPSSDVGPPGLNWLIHYPLLYRRLSDDARFRVDQRATRPSGAPWLKHRVVDLVRETSGVEIEHATPRGEQLELGLSDGSTRTVDHLFLATGFRPHLDSLGFLDADLRADLLDHDGFPLLNPWFEASVPDLYFCGAIASYNFGPLCRFVAGARVSARQILRHSERTLRRSVFTSASRSPEAALTNV
ncbi:MAG: FAD-dependent oxidoreductase [Ktedonobacterales bacterium]